MREEREKEEKRIRRKENAIIITVGILCAVIFAAGLFYASRHIVNEGYNLAYDFGYYFDRTPTTYMIPNRPEGYIPYYNTGNNDFQNGRYKEARDNYLRALEEQPPHHTDEEHVEGEEDIECKIRINLALSILNMIDFENLYLTDREAVDKAAEQLLIARSVLTAEDCAHFNDPKGHDADAEQLKKEIDEMLERLNRKPPEEEEEQQQGGGENDQQQQQGGDGEDEQSQREKEIEDRLQREMSESKEQQMQSERDRERMRRAGEGDEFGFNGDSKGQAW